MTVMQSSEWVEALTKQIGQGIDQARQKRSDQWISDRTEQLGNPISRTAVSEYRRGVRKTISVSDWLTIAAALGVPPVALLFPGLPDSQVIALPNSGKVNALDAARWVTGEDEFLPDGSTIDAETGNLKPRYQNSMKQYAWTADDLYQGEESAPLTQLLQQSRQYAENFDRLNTEVVKLARVSSGEESKAVVNYVMEVLDHLREKQDQLRDRIQELGGTVAIEHVKEGGNG